MKAFLSDLFYAIKTGDGKAKAFYIMAFIILILTVLGFIGGVIGGVVCLTASNFQILPFALSAVSLAIFIGVLIWLNHLRRA